jgi:hypothetical protein
VVEIIDTPEDSGDQHGKAPEADTGEGDTGVRFPGVIGQERIRQALARSLVNQRVPHAMLFLGDDGVGKEATALDFARALLCRGSTGQ